MSVSCVVQNGERYVVSPFVSGDFWNWSQERRSEYIAVMLAYYGAVRADAESKVGGVSGGSRDAAGVGRSSCTRIARLASAVGGNIGEGLTGDADAGCTCEAVPRGVADGGCSDTHENFSRADTSGGGASVTEDVSVSSRRGCDNGDLGLWVVVFFCVESEVERLLSVAHDAGAGEGSFLGRYGRCSWRGRGHGSFIPLEGSVPTVGVVGAATIVEECRVEVLCASREIAMSAVGAVRSNGSYEVTVCYAFQAEGLQTEADPRDVRSLNCGDGKLRDGRGKNYERNRRNRIAQKHRRRLRSAERSTSVVAEEKVMLSVESDGEIGLRSAFVLCDDSTRKSLAESRARRLIVENEQAEEKARRQLEIMRASDVTKDIKQHQTRVNAAIERNMVSIEKAHATLVATGNVPGEIGGFAQTIVNSGSISPNSSASLQEFRKCQKDLLDSEEYNARLVATLKEAGMEVPHTAQSDREHNRKLGIWTENSENLRIINEDYPDYDLQYGVCGLEGKVKIIRPFDMY